jgi:hypothetical protein
MCHSIAEGGRPCSGSLTTQAERQAQRDEQVPQLRSVELQADVDSSNRHAGDHRLRHTAVDGLVEQTEAQAGPPRRRRSSAVKASS